MNYQIPFLLNRINNIFFSCVLSLALILGLIPCKSFSQEVPTATSMVTDEASLFTAEERRQLESRLQALSDSTSNQIAVYTTSDLRGYDIFEVALAFGRKNGVGQQKNNNGIVMVIKPKNDRGKGHAFILVGKGLEGPIPDALAKRIVENELIPNFKLGNYVAGINEGVEVLAKLASGEFTEKTYRKKHGDNASKGAGFIFIIIAIFVFIALSGNRRYASRNNLGFWAAMGLFNTIGSRHRGTWNDFSGGGSSGSGFGGFGGGGFGGGGAGGSW